MPKGGSPGKGSPGKASSAKGSANKGSPKKGASPKRDGSPKHKKSPDLIEQLPTVLKNVRRKSTWTENDLPKCAFKEMQCPNCYLIIDNFTQFLAHCCWRKFYQARFHLAETQAFGCRTCRMVFYSHADYDTHSCNDHKLCNIKRFQQVEEVLPIDYKDHFDFYINWHRRTEWEAKSHEPEWDFQLRCIRCGNFFKRRMEYLLHSCFQFTLLKPAIVRRLKTCTYCKCVFLDQSQFSMHLEGCKPSQAECLDLRPTTFEIVCQQFVLARHCYEFDHCLAESAESDVDAKGLAKNKHAPQPAQENQKETQPIIVGCTHCGFEQPNLYEFLFHPCMAGRLITPYQLELVLYCNQCHCLFLSIDDVVNHFKSCVYLVFTFVRLNTPKLVRLALTRWTLETHANPYLPARQQQFMCGACKEMFRQFRALLVHSCPRYDKYERLLIQPSALMETYVCQACHLVLFSTHQAVTHSINCVQGRFQRLWQVHYTLEEAVDALTLWMKGPQLVQLDFSLGVGDPEDESAMKEEEIRVANNLPSIDVMTWFQGENRPSKRITAWLMRRKQESKNQPRSGSQFYNQPQHTKVAQLNEPSSDDLSTSADFSLPTINMMPFLRKPILPCHSSASLYNRISLPIGSPEMGCLVNFK
ncbi:unnamed protein product [Protopolystoma xenopodis]|uniref:Uncharacterized protein n=1 Tax=Protopolystoma xenopodis TaxID=117903 RepID=A0A448WB78_9PLAT|nr:unnamed protein product [Protopolystoma xenopodis]